MGLWGWVWGGRSRSQLVKTNGKRRFTRHHNPYRHVVTVISAFSRSGAMGELQSALAVGLEIMLQGMNVFTLDDLAAALRGRGDAVAAAAVRRSQPCKHVRVQLIRWPLSARLSLTSICCARSWLQQRALQHSYLSAHQRRHSAFSHPWSRSMLRNLCWPRLCRLARSR